MEDSGARLLYSRSALHLAFIAAKRRHGLAAIHRQRERLEQWCADQRLGADAFLNVQGELDFAEVSLTSENERHIEES